jgi:L-galactose dehydrogenase
MFAVREALSRPERLRETVAELIAQGHVDADQIDPADPLGFVLAESDAPNLPNAAYRFCRAEPGMHVVLSGTGSAAHLDENIAAIGSPPLPDAVHRRLVEIFRRVDTVSGE